MKQYLDLVANVFDNGIDLNPSKERTGTGTRSLYGQTMKFDLASGFPLVTTKRTFWKGVIEELLWFLRGETNIKPLQDAGVHIWDEWADEEGNLGPVYGQMWRKWPDGKGGWVDQLENVLDLMRNSPHSRRNVVSAWNPTLLPDASKSHLENIADGKQVLPPCHTLWQVMVDGNGQAHMTLYQRSADLFLGVPFNIASYSALLIYLCHVTGLKARSFTWMGGDCHLYHNHFNQVQELLTREPRPLPNLAIATPPSIPVEELTADDFLLMHYDPMPAIKAEVAV